MNCPHCHTYISEAQFIESEFNEDTNWYEDHMHGRCSNCGRTYNWVEVYVFSHIEHIKEVQPDE